MTKSAVSGYASVFVIPSSFVIRISSFTSSRFLRWLGGLGFLFASDAELLQERLDRLFAAEEFFDRKGDIARVTRLVNFMAQFQTGLFVEIALLRFFKNGRHIGGDRVGPSVAVVARVIAVEVTE